MSFRVTEKSIIFQTYRSISVVVVTGLPARGQRNSGSSPRQGKEIFVYSKPLDGVCGRATLLPNMSGGFFPHGYIARGVKLTNHHHPVSSLRMSGVTPPVYIYIYFTVSRRGLRFYMHR